MREIISFQVGASSNFIGTHFWNFQEGNEDTEMSILYRYGQNEKGVDTAHPRVLIFDDYDNLGSYHPGGYSYHQGQNNADNLQFENDTNHQTLKDKELNENGIPPLQAKFGNFRNVNSVGSVCGENAVHKKWETMENIPWHGKLVVDKKNRTSARNIFTDYLGDEESYYNEQTYIKTSADQDERMSSKKVINLDGNCKVSLDPKYKKEHNYKYWTEFTLQDYHPRSIFPINSSLNPVNEWSYTDEMSDNFRFFAEEADSVQGIHLFNDLHQRCYPLTLSLLEDIHDQYSSAPLMSFLCPSLLSSNASYESFFNNSMKEIDEVRALQAIDHIQTARVLRLLMEECKGTVIPLMTNLNSQTEENTIFPGLNLHAGSSQYTTSAIHAIAVDTATSIYRTKNVTNGLNASVSKCNMKDFTRWLAHGCVPLLSLEMDLPWPHPSLKIDSLDKFSSFLEPNLKNIRDVLLFRPSKGPLSSLKPLSFPYRSYTPEQIMGSAQRYTRYSGAVTVRGCKYDINEKPKSISSNINSGNIGGTFYGLQGTNLDSISCNINDTEKYRTDINTTQVERALNEQLKYYPWFQPNVNVALRSRVGLTYEFPTAIWDHRVPNSHSPSETTDLQNGAQVDPFKFCDPTEMINQGGSCITWLGCTSGLRPWLNDIAASCEEALKHNNHASNIGSYMKVQYGLDGDDLAEIREYIVEVKDSLSQEVNSFEDDDDIDFEN